MKTTTNVAEFVWGPAPNRDWLKAANTPTGLAVYRYAGGYSARAFKNYWVGRDHREAVALFNVDTEFELQCAVYAALERINGTSEEPTSST
ncbi:hypothetical protein [Pseudolabrys sp.]|uniref:hypothetical protein n=1 Tax=Pseudolabrys sp. TaxID=1960880 RepID=UPI003D0AFCD9